jgi:DNA polymerase-3 subunit epsilon
MNLQLTKSLCVFDLETTGLQINTDRIVQIAIIKLNPSGERTELNQLINPEMTIPQEVIDIHGVSNELIQDKPTFSQFAPELIEFIGDADLAGYNSNKFDIPVLAEEFLRVGINFDFSFRKFIDIQNIFHKMEQRTLAAAYKFYCGEEMKNAHDALYDTQATLDVFLAQLERYKETPELKSKTDVTSLAEFSRAGTFELIDLAGRLAKNEKGEAVYNFGKHKGKTIKEVSKIEPGYFGWMTSDQTDFPRYTKECMRREMEKIKEAEKKDAPITENSLESLKNKFNSK